MRRVVEDVPYTREQIKTLIDNTTLRNRCMILVMASAGLRREHTPPKIKRYSENSQV